MHVLLQHLHMQGLQEFHQNATTIFHQNIFPGVLEAQQSIKLLNMIGKYYTQSYVFVCFLLFLIQNEDIQQNAMHMLLPDYV
jgi:hypothetical protein